MKYLSDAFIGSYVIVIDSYGHCFTLNQRLQIIAVTTNEIYRCSDSTGTTQVLRKMRLRVAHRKELE